MNEFYFVGNNLALDLANTLAADNDGRDVDLTGSYDDLIDWALEAKILDRRQATDAKRDTDKAVRSSVLKQAIELRTALKSMAAALDPGKPVPTLVIDQINSVLARKQGHYQILRTSDGYKSRLNIEYEDLRDLMFPVAESAMRLLCYSDLSLVRKCRNPACVLYFLDTSKRHGRKWCSMDVCGNRSKAAAFYDRNRVGSRSLQA